ncbi:MAG: hypothetical protein J6X58_06270 [Bacteroidales bacterium]|nr:hypothetical protein [Bacteroidales bacterium]
MDILVIIQIVLLPIIISIISNYGIWAFPYKKWKPNISIGDVYTKIKKVDKTIIKEDKTTGEEKELRIEEKEVRIKFEMVNTTKRNAYRIDVYFEFMDKSDVVQYVRAEQRPFLEGGKNLLIDSPFKYDGIKVDNIEKVNINVAYQNKFGAIFSTCKQKKLDIK